MTLLKFDELKTKKHIPFCRSHVWKLVKEGTFPKPIKLGKRATLWVESEVDDYLSTQRKARYAPPPPPVPAK